MDAGGQETVPGRMSVSRVLTDGTYSDITMFQQLVSIGGRGGVDVKRYYMEVGEERRER